MAFQKEQGSATAMIQLPLASSEGALGSAISNAALIEPLSRRELEVLHLMSLGRSNQEIAQQLIVAPGTIKAHTASIYRKLNVTNRTEAAARARHLGILP
jgi:ATP/maltotriose-dependent transcriptional regulator MalT